MNPRDLPLDRLSTTDREGRRVYLYPADVKGPWHSRRGWVGAVLIAVFLALPWIRIHGRPAILLDLPGRRFSVFGLMFWAHDAPILLFVIGGAVLTIALLTAVWGRAWCGWACPQTVFTEHVFRRIERWIEGDSVVRKRMDQGPWNAGKIVRKTLKWGVFAALSLVIGHSFLAYFTGTEALAAMLRSSPLEHPESFLVMAVFSGGVLFDFGWFREQFCTVVCPYGRFQSVLMDAQSKVVAYDTSRTDCVNCFRCVAVCPTGIDIRRGAQQLECISCTSCMDVCDQVMSRIGKPPRLIGYRGKGIAAALRPRVLILFGLTIGCAGAIALTVSRHRDLDAEITRAVDTPYSQITGEDGRPAVLNHFKLDLRNQSFGPMHATLAISPEAAAKGVAVVSPPLPERLEAGQSHRGDFFVRFPREFLVAGSAIVTLQFRGDSGAPIFKEVKLVGPYR